MKTNYPINSIVYCNSNTTTAEKCQIKSTRFEWGADDRFSYGYTVYSLETKETFNCPVERMFATKFQAEHEATTKHDNLQQKYMSNINSVQELQNFATIHMQSVSIDKAAVEAFKAKSEELLGVSFMKDK